MLHPTGPLPPSVYWRRRLLLLLAVVVLLGVTVWVLRPGGAGKPAASRLTGSHSTVTSTSTSAAVTSPGTSASTRSASTASTADANAAQASTSAGPAQCLPASLKVSAVPGASTYKIGDSPQLLMQVINVGPAPCVQDLADSQVELRVYNGESRVWGSHDCEIEPGTAQRTLTVGQAVRVSVTWSGLSSEPKCAGTRQRVGAGTYTLYALLSGHIGTAAQFSIGSV